MKSAGNDIVALKYLNKQRTAEYRFYSKILSVYEQELYQQAQYKQLPFEHYVWLLWSVKESAFKFLKRFHPALEFFPAKFVIRHLDIPYVLLKQGESEWENGPDDEPFYTGKIIYEGNVLYFCSKITAAWIASIVNDEEDFSNISWGVKSIDTASYNDQSKTARAFLLEKLNHVFTPGLQIAKNPFGYPEIIKGDKIIPIPVSLSHDHEYVAYSFLLSSEDILQEQDN